MAALARRGDRRPTRPRSATWTRTASPSGPTLSSTLVRSATTATPLHFLSQMQDVTERRAPRGRAAPPRRPRPADRAAQPPLVRARARAPRRAGGALRPARRGDRARPRPLQDDQRHARPRRRRRADRARRARAPRSGCATPTCSRGSAATSSPCCCPRAGARRPRRSPRACSRRCAARPCSPARATPRRVTRQHRHRAVHAAPPAHARRACWSRPTWRCTTPRTPAATATPSPTARRPTAAVGGRMSWADQIRDALDEDRFVLHAQPIVDVATGRDRPVRAAAADDRPRRRADRARRVPARRRALRPDRRDRPLGRAPRDRHARRGQRGRARRSPPRSTCPAARPATRSCSR